MHARIASARTARCLDGLASSPFSRARWLTAFAGSPWLSGVGRETHEKSPKPFLTSSREARARQKFSGTSLDSRACDWEFFGLLWILTRESGKFWQDSGLYFLAFYFSGASPVSREEFREIFAGLWIIISRTWKFLRFIRL